MLNSYIVIITIITHSIHHHMLDNCNNMTGRSKMLALYQLVYSLYYVLLHNCINDYVKML